MGGSVFVSNRQLRVIQAACNGALEKVGSKHTDYTVGVKTRGVAGWPLVNKVFSKKHKETIEIIKDCKRNGQKTTSLSDEPKHPQEHKYAVSYVVDLKSIGTAINSAGAKNANCDGTYIDPSGTPMTVLENTLGRNDYELVKKDVMTFDRKIRSLRFLVHYDQIDAIVSRGKNPLKTMGSDVSAMETVFANSTTLQERARMFFVEQVVAKNQAVVDEKLPGIMSTYNGKNSCEIYAKVVDAVGKENVVFDKVMVLDTKNRISSEFYYKLHGVTDWFGGLYGYWYKRALNDQNYKLPDFDANAVKSEFQPRISRLESRIADAKIKGKDTTKLESKLEKVMKELNGILESHNPGARKYAEECLAYIKEKIWTSMLTVREISAEHIEKTTIYQKKVQIIRLENVPLIKEIGKVMDDVRKAYSSKMIPNRFYLQNLATLKESLLLILAGLGVVKVVQMGLEKFGEGAMWVGITVAVFGEVLANAINGVADLLSGSVNTGPKGEGREQAKQEHASSHALKWGLLGGAVSSTLNALSLSMTKGAWFAYSFFHSLSGNFTTQTVSQGGVLSGLVAPSARILKVAGVLEKKSNAVLEAFKEVNLNNIFRLYQTVIGSVTLWASSFAIGYMGIIEHPAKYAWGGMALFFTAVLETPFAALGILVTPVLNRLSIRRNVKKAVKNAEL